MGSYITLGVNKMEIDWGKNNIFNNHSKLFLSVDHSNNIPIFDVDEENNEIVRYGMGAKKSLGEVRKRLDLLGYSLKEIKILYDSIVMEYEMYMGDKFDVSFEDFSAFIKCLDLSKINHITSSIDSYENGYDIGEYFSDALLNDLEFSKKFHEILQKVKIGEEYGESFFENIHPYIILRLLAENEENLKYDVIWNYDEVLKEGWVDFSELKKELEIENKILIVTEGKSDSFIIRKTLDNLYPNISDFFEFIDMEENYPFTGVGNLVNFTKGLSKINIQNNVIIIFDNDTVGLESYTRIKDIIKPHNLVLMHLPNLDEFDNFACVGPDGLKNNNINGKAVAIECFLDFNSVGDAPCVRWNSYNLYMEQYQGELIKKDLYVQKFKKAKLDSTYDVHKLKYLIDYIISCWVNR